MIPHLDRLINQVLDGVPSFQPTLYTAHLEAIMGVKLCASN